MKSASARRVSGDREGRTGRRRVNQRGFVLVAVLWAVVLLGFLATSFAGGARSELNLARNVVEGAKAEALADAGVYRAISVLLDAETAIRLLSDRTVREWRFGGGLIRYRIEAEEGKVSLNAGEPDVLEALLGVIGAGPDAARSLANRIVDYRDSDDTPRDGGAERDAYLAAGLANRPKNAPFELVEEIDAVLGMTEALSRRIRPHLSVFSASSRPPREWASPVVQATLDRLAEDPSERRAGRPVAPEIPIDDDGDTAPVPVEVLGAGFVTIHAEARTEGGGLFAREAIVGLTNDPEQPYQIFDWRRGERLLF